MANIQFKSNKVLFKANHVTFCAADCTCGNGVDPPPPPPPPECPARIHCPLLPDTPDSYQVSFAGVTYAGDIHCASGNSFSFTGSLSGTYTLTQDVFNPCRWIYDNPASPLTLTGYDGDLTGAATVTNRLRIVLTKLDTGWSLTATMVQTAVSGAEVYLFSGTTTDISSPIAGTSPPTTCLNWRLSGCREGTGGTAVVTPCIAVVSPVCSCVDGTVPHCLTLSGMGIGDCDKFTAYTGITDDTVFRTTVSLTHSASCTWTTGTITASGFTDVTFTLTFDATGERGCGWYGVLSGSGGDAGLYFLANNSSPVGIYAQYFSYCSGTPAYITITATPCTIPHDCSAFDSWPTFVHVEIVDGFTTDPILQITGGYDVPRFPGQDYFQLGADFADPLHRPLLITITCEDTRWKIELSTGDIGGYFYFQDFEAGAHGGGPKIGSYTWYDGTDDTISPDPQWHLCTVAVS